jgi:NitT/TauT family transport system ATP-binding protein
MGAGEIRRPLCLPSFARTSLLTSQPVIHFADLKQTFGKDDGSSVAALDGITFDIGRHEFIAVLGPSGCGKSTLLRLIAGLIKPTSGSLEIYGLQVTEPRDDIGIVFQKPTLLPWFNVLDNVTFPMRHKYGRVTAEERVRAQDLLALVGLSDFAGKQIDELSGGMQQRVGVVRALANNPEVLLMDEPFASVDAQTRMTLQEELTRIWQERRPTVIFITHDVPEAVFLANRVVVLSKGRVLDQIAVDLPRPRVWDDLIEDDTFKRLSAQVLHMVRSA